MSTHIRKFLDISTGHLTLKTREALEAGLSNVSYADHGYGWWIYATEDEDVRQLFPDDIAEICRFARKHDCDWINLDCDAEQIEGLPYYEDD